VPKVVVGASERALTEVIKLWMDGNDEALKDHPVQISFWRRIVDQLKGSESFRKRGGMQKTSPFRRNTLRFWADSGGKEKGDSSITELKKRSRAERHQRELVGLIRI